MFIVLSIKLAKVFLFLHITGALRPFSWSVKSLWKFPHGIRIWTTRVPSGCWWETLTPKEMGGTPKWTSRTWGDWAGRRSGGQTGPVPCRGGWKGGGVPTPGGTLGDSDQGGMRWAFPLPNWPGSQAGPTPSEAPSRPCCSWGLGGRSRENRRGRREGPSRTGGSGEERRVFAPPTRTRKPAALLGRVPHPLRPEAQPGPLLSSLSSTPLPGPFPALWVLS